MHWRIRLALSILLAYGTHVSFATEFTPGNVLVTQNNVLLEYTRVGELVQQIPVPHPDTSRRDATDIIVDEYGRAYVLNIAPFDNDYLSIYDPAQTSWTHHPVAAFLGNISDGDLSISLDGKSAYTKSLAISLEDFSTINISISGRGVAEISMGFDGYLYALDSGSPRHGVRVLDPGSFEILNTLILRDEQQYRINARGIAVTETGDIFVSAWDGRFYAYDSSATLIDYCQLGYSFIDLDLSVSDGVLVAGSRFGTIAIVDVSFDSIFTFPTHGSEAYVCFVPFEKGSNTLPIADAGEDVVVYAGVDGTTTVKLDGSGSFDADGDELDYFWFEDPNQIAEGVDPNVVLVVGEHLIELVVFDGALHSEPNSMIVTVIEPIEARGFVVPQVLNLSSRGKYVMAIVYLPEGVSVDDVKGGSFGLYADGAGGSGVSALWEWVYAHRSTGRAIVVFDRTAVIEAIGGQSSAKVYVAGELSSGQYIYVEDSIRVVKAQRRTPRRTSSGRSRR